MVNVKKITDEGDYFHVRFRHPSTFSTIRTPDWAEDVAQSVSKGAQVRMGKTSAGNWLVQTILIEKGGGKNAMKAGNLARRIKAKIESGSRAG